MKHPEICPFTITPRRSALTPDQVQLDHCDCIGPLCKLWRYSEGSDPNTGDCAFNITAEASALTAHLMAQMFNSPAAKADRKEKEN